MKIISILLCFVLLFSVAYACDDVAGTTYYLPSLKDSAVVRIVFGNNADYAEVIKEHNKDIVALVTVSEDVPFYVSNLLFRLEELNYNTSNIVGYGFMGYSSLLSETSHFFEFDQLYFIDGSPEYFTPTGIPDVLFIETLENKEYMVESYLWYLEAYWPQEGVIDNIRYIQTDDWRLEDE